MEFCRIYLEEKVPEQSLCDRCEQFNHASGSCPYLIVADLDEIERLSSDPDY